jgi:hypothetical protein
MTKDQLKRLEADLWAAADNLRANSDLKSSEYSTPVLGLIFLKFADNNYRRHEQDILAEYQKLKRTRREKSISDIAIEKCGFYLPDHARYNYLLNLPEEKDIAKALNRSQRKLSLDQSLCHLAEAKGPRGAGHGQLRLRRPPFRGRHPPHVDREEPHLRDADAALEHVLHRHAPGHALVLRQGQGRAVSQWY